MSCNNCQSVTPCNCSSDPCNPNNNTGCEHVIYTGPSLVCSTIDPGDTMCVALQKIDAILCSSGGGASVTASNGLYKNLFANDIRMGGPLTEVTTIGTSNINTLSITGLVTDSSPLYILVQTNLGVVRKTLTSVLTTNILSQITADNGITYTPTNIQLGGSLIKPTVITATSTNTLAIAGLVSNPSATYIVSVDNSTGVLTKTALSAILPTAITADNGLTKTSNNIQLGGPLIKTTTVDLSGYTLSLTDSGPNNGIKITPGTFTDCVGCSPNCNPYTAYIWNTNVNEFYSKNLFHSVSRFDNNVGIGTTPDSNVVTCGNGTKLTVERVITGPFTSHGTFSAFRGAGGSALTLNGALGNDGNPTSGGGYLAETNAGWGTTLNMNPTTNVTLINHDPYNHSVTYSGSKSGISFGGDNGGLSVLGQLAAYTSRSLFSDQGGAIAPNKNGMSLETYIGFQAESPQAYSGGYTGTLTNAIGVKIEDQRSAMGGGCYTNPNPPYQLICTGTLTNSYGIVQGHQTDYNIGRQDKNIFNGPAAFYNNVAIGLNNVQNRFNTAGNQVPGTRLFTYRSEALTSEAITAASNSLLEMGGPSSSWGGNCSIYAGAFDYLYWAPWNNININTILSSEMTITGHGSYITVATPAATTNSNLASNTAQVFSTNTSLTITGVFSSGSVLTLPYLTDPTTGLTITVGSQIAYVSGTGSFGTTKNVFVDAIVSAIAPYQVSLKTYATTSPTGGYTTFTPTTPLANATIEVGLAGGSIDRVIAYRAKSPVPYQAGGSLLAINTAVGLQIDDQKAFINTTWNTSTQKSTGTLTNSYGIVQKGQNDKNQFNAIQNIFPNIPLYTNDAAATADTNLPSGSLYRINSDVRAIRWKP